jgi:hypothetical protein
MKLFKCSIIDASDALEVISIPTEIVRLIVMVDKIAEFILRASLFCFFLCGGSLLRCGVFAAVAGVPSERAFSIRGLRLCRLGGLSFSCFFPKRFTIESKKVFGSFFFTKKFSHGREVKEVHSLPSLFNFRTVSRRVSKCLATSGQFTISSSSIPL